MKLFILIILFITNIFAISINNEPYQKILDKSNQSIIYLNNIETKKIAYIEFKTRILHIKKYDSKHIPFDLALGWNKMSDLNILKHVKITQSNRWFYWKTRKSIINRNDIESSSSNFHIIPLNKNILNKVQNLKKYDIVIIKGYLVNTFDELNRKFNSSLSRTDIGGGACEVMLITDLKKVEK
jgi:hypothetical protein